MIRALQPLEMQLAEPAVIAARSLAENCCSLADSAGCAVSRAATRAAIAYPLQRLAP